MGYEAVDCIDAGTDYCPCYLAETNNCLICSQLQGKAFCDCINWKGVCIYQEYIWNNNQMKEPRKSINVEVLEYEIVNENVIFLKLKVSKTMARELKQPGSYIFIRDEKYPDFFDVPISVMYCDENNETIDLLIQVRGTKTKVLKNIGKYLLIRGPYWNGIIGLKNLKMLSNKNCLIIARGVSQAPSVMVAKKLKISGNKVLAVLDDGNLNIKLPQKYFENIGCNITKACLIKDRAFIEDARHLVNDIIIKENIDFIFTGGSDLIHQNIISIIKSIDKNILFSCTNNANICCGEGICGSCMTRINNGKKVKTCKAQLNPLDIFGGIH